jgi:hypothetical protein
MRSLIILEVEHGEDTDALSLLLETLADEDGHGVIGASAANVINATVRVDLPECFRLDNA